MRKTAFIVCEYDPFHNGHALHIQKTREAGAEEIVCLMSGNFVQRGEIAFCDKAVRARFAIDNGADLVLELPLKYVLSGAPYFAKGAAEIIHALHVPGTLSFGAQASLQTLETLAALTENKEILVRTDDYALLHGTSFAHSMQKVLAQTNPEESKALTDANNILAIEYFKALRRIGADTDYFALQRTVPHDAEKCSESIASARFIRETMRTAGSPYVCEQYMPAQAFSVLEEYWKSGKLPSDKIKFSAACMARLLSINESALLSVNGVNQGMENRILQCMKDCSDLYMLFDAVKTKRFTHARIRQILLSAALGIKKEALERKNPYIRVLGMNQKGRAFLREVHNSTDVPLIMNLSEAPECEERELDALSGRLYDICRPVPLHRNPEYALKPYVSE